jgi:phytoene dehydrogenase-like protein
VAGSHRTPVVEVSVADEVDAVVVGSGPNGLVAAVTLAEAGWRVLVLEAASTYGGGLRTQELTLPGFRHDVCSAVHPLASASPAFRALDLGRDGLALRHPPVPLGHPLSPGRSVLLRRDVEQTAGALGRDAGTWRRVVGGLARHWESVTAGVLDPFALPPRAPLATAAFGAVGVWPTTAVARLLREEPARALLAGLAGHATLDLSAPLTTGVGLLLGLLGHAVGWPVVEGGSQAVADALVARLRTLGGEVRTGNRVTDVDDLPGARAVLLDLTPRQVLQVAGHRLPPAYRRRLARWRYGAGAFKVDWALDAPVPWVDGRLAGAGTLHLGGSAAEVVAAEREVAAGRLPDRPYVLLVQASVADPSRAPSGKHTLWGYCHVPNGCTVDMTAAIEAQVERLAPGFADRVLARHVMGPASLQAHNANYVGGDIAGGESDWRQLAARPVLSRTPWATPDPRLFLCSSSTPPGGGVHGMGGRHAAVLALRRWG